MTDETKKEPISEGMSSMDASAQEKSAAGTTPEDEDRAEKKAAFILVSSKVSRRRAGIRFGEGVTKLKKADLTKDQIEAIQNDSILAVKEA